MEETKIEDSKEKKAIGKTLGAPIVNKPKRKRFILPLILILLLVGAAGYIGYDKWQEREAEIFRLGAEYGYEVRLLDIFNQGLNCNEPIAINNGTLEINLIAIECLNILEE